MNKNSILQHLSVFNMVPEEAEIYVFLLKHGESSPRDIAKETGLKRPSVYNYIESLVRQQLAQWKIGAAGKIAIPINPENLSLKIDELKRQQHQIQQAYHDVLPELQSLRKPGDFSTDVKYYVGVEGVKQVILNSLQARNGVYGYSTFGRASVVGQDFINEFRSQWLETDQIDHVIISNEKIAESIPSTVRDPRFYSTQKLRYYPKDKLYISNDIMFYNNIYAVSNLDPQRPYAYEIYNDEVVKTELSIFNILWENAKKIKWSI